MLLQELLDRSDQAASGVAGAPEPQADREITAYVLYPHAVRAVYREQAKTGRHLDNLSHEHLIELQSGEGLLPDEVFREYLDRSMLPDYQFGSLVPFEDYGRYRFDTQMAYYAARGKKFFCTKEPGLISTLAADEVVMTANGDTVTISDAALTADNAGQRIKVVTAVGGTLLDAFIKSVSDAETVLIEGLVPFNLNGAATVYLYDDEPYVAQRSLTAVVTTSQSRIVTCATGEFTQADVGRRFQAREIGAGLTYADAIITSVESATSLTLWSKATEFDDGGVADIMYSPLKLQAVGIPALPTDLCDAIDLAPEVAEDVIVKIASVLRGEMPLQKLIEVGRG